MKKLLFLSLMIAPFWAKADCGDSYGNAVSAGTTGTWSVSDAVTTISENAGCSKNWNDKTSCRAYISGVEDLQLSQMFNTGTVSWANVANRLYAIGGSASSGITTTIVLKITLDGPNWGWSDHVLDRFFNITVYHAGSVSLIPQVFCSGKDYEFADIVTSPVQHVGKALAFSTGDNFSGTIINFTQPVNNIVTVTYTATSSGYAIARSWTVPMHELRQGYFTDTPDNLSVNSNDVDLGLYSFYSAGSVREFFGTGVYYFGNQWLFSPSSAGNGDHVLSMRVNNQGCYSDYRDTTFTVIGIASITQPPVLDFTQTFGAGETGGLLYRRYPPYIDYDGNPEPGFDQPFVRFHFGCSNRNYTFYVQNPLSNLTYEWVIYYHNLIYQTGTGNTITVSMPDRSSVDEDVFYGLQPFPWPDSTYISHFVDGPGDYEGNYLGDVLRVTVRKKNIINEVSNYSEWLVGLVDTPVLEDDQKICYTTDPTLVSVSESEVYLSYPDETVLRSMRWDIDMDGDWELAGDSVVYNVSNANKVNLFKGQVVDTTKFWLYSETNNDWNTFVFPAMDEVCYSGIDTVRIVRNPDFNVDFNEVGQVNIGTPVRSIVTGTYFNPSTDTIHWQWSDGSGGYYGDTTWHYLNDLGFYSLVVTVTDQYGCSSSEDYFSSWFVPGFLSLDELDEKDIILYPVPVIDKLTIIGTEKIESWELRDLSGKTVLSGNELELNLADLAGGNYLMVISTAEGTVTRKIVKL